MDRRLAAFLLRKLARYGHTANDRLNRAAAEELRFAARSPAMHLAHEWPATMLARVCQYVGKTEEHPVTCLKLAGKYLLAAGVCYCVTAEVELWHETIAGLSTSRGFVARGSQEAVHALARRLYDEYDTQEGSIVVRLYVVPVGSYKGSMPLLSADTLVRRGS